MFLVLKVIGLLAVLLVVLFILFVLITGRGTIKEDAISEKTFIEVNGHKNGLIIRGKDKENPVLLFISGGPGVPQYWINEYYHNKIEDCYTVCWWDYIGEGMSYDASISKEEITIERLSKDAIRVAKYLKERFGKEKIYLMAHSGGTPLGLYLAQEDKEDFYCYFAMGQLINENNLRFTAGYSYLKSYFEKRGDIRAIKKLNQLMKKDQDGVMVPVNPEQIAGPWEKLLLKAGCGTTRKMRSDAIDIFFPQMFSSCYTVKEKVNFWRGKILHTKTPYYDFTIDLASRETVIPVYFISGRYDYTCPVTLVEELYRKMKAPKKDLFIFEQSAHSPLWEQNEEVLQAMTRICKEQ